MSVPLSSETLGMKRRAGRGFVWPDRPPVGTGRTVLAQVMRGRRRGPGELRAAASQMLPP